MRSSKNQKLDFGFNLIISYATSCVDSKTYKFIIQIILNIDFLHNTQQRLQPRAFVHETQHLFGSIEPHAFMNGQKFEKFLYVFYVMVDAIFEQSLYYNMFQLYFGSLICSARCENTLRIFLAFWCKEFFVMLLFCHNMIYQKFNKFSVTFIPL